ncbi:DUF4867 family protein [Alkalicoccus urumqiensis]|uniref:DUF4867 domain-containing protein n=1 Tax=Alkalicoccus urumqiensis TaxID=1548213 RepID=A0A2P6MHT2_ALKUR|nr:DUF4867 family protein [Alkalicoccus urumqiensis]PRO65849.1 DUF4867 domain-containing protein [Alkalicoccus urumqiensis]
MKPQKVMMFLKRYLKVVLFMPAVSLSDERIPLQHLTSSRFTKYGTLLDADAFQAAVPALQRKAMPEAGNVYVASDPSLEDDSSLVQEAETVFGEMDIQVGYCNGYTNAVNALEYHKSSEINVAATDFILCLGRLEKGKSTFDLNQAEFFYVKKGEAFELYPEVLHFAPMAVCGDGFQCLVILPRGTNEELTREASRRQDPVLFKKNKWLLAHPERDVLIDQGAVPGLLGDNIYVKGRQ